MKGLRDTIVGWVDRRIEDMLAAPRMWGSDEAVEMQLLVLLEMRALATRPDQELANPSRILDAYNAYLAKRFPAKPHRPMCRIVEPDDLGFVLAAELRKFIDVFVPTMLEENPYQHSDVAIRLTFEAGRMPTTSAFTGYYEEFRRAARAVARPPDKATGRVAKGVEMATDFALNDARVTPRNGSPAEVLLLLGAGAGQRDTTAEEQVRDALTNLVSMGEWASSSADVADVPVDDVEQRTRVAVQALRILPRRGIAAAEIGGKLIGRSKPVAFRPEHERRIVDVIGSSTKPESFDRQDEIRGIDLDRGLIILGKKSRLTCYMRPEQLGSVALAGVQAHVRGSLYRPLSGRPFVLVESLDLIEPAEEE
jgi:hypothetical protein